MKSFKNLTNIARHIRIEIRNMFNFVFPLEAFSIRIRQRVTSAKEYIFQSFDLVRIDRRELVQTGRIQEANLLDGRGNRHQIPSDV